MNKILIVYPRAFKCQSKFDRKVGRITERLGDFMILSLHDESELIKEFIQQHEQDVELRFIDGPIVDDCTHAIVFDDGEEFPDLVDLIRNKGVPLRLIDIAISRVINIKMEPEFQGVRSTDRYEYIARGSYWGNPHSMYEDGEDREEVIRKYKYDFDFEKFPNKDKKEVYKLAGKRLGCFCKPQACHGDILADYLNAWDDGK